MLQFASPFSNLETSYGYFNDSICRELACWEWASEGIMRRKKVSHHSSDRSVHLQLLLIWLDRGHILTIYSMRLNSLHPQKSQDVFHTRQLQRVALCRPEIWPSIKCRWWCLSTLTVYTWCMLELCHHPQYWLSKCIQRLTNKKYS